MGSGNWPEIHAQLATKTKIFSGSSTTYGAEPNTQACAIDLGLPGVLPSFNEEALRMAVKFGLAINAEIGKVSVFDRKTILPRSAQRLSNYAAVLPYGGQGPYRHRAADGSSKRINVTRAHLEEDAGKSVHEGFRRLYGHRPQPRRHTLN